MWLEVLLAVTCAGWRVSALPPISHWDLEAGNWTCDGRASCKDYMPLPARLMWAERNCQCDKECSTYGDCCLDSPYFELREQRRGAASFTCVKLPQIGGVYMRTSCPPEWSEPTNRALCENASDNIRDPVAGLPATDVSTGVSYRNRFCAICHGAEEESSVWQPRVECYRVPPSVSLTSENITQLLIFNEREGRWGIDLNNTFYPCNVYPEIPNISDHSIRRCIPNITKTCGVNWTNPEIRARCEAYTSLVYEAGNVYRNSHCAMCNSVPLQSLQCSTLLYKFDFDVFRGTAFSILLDISSGPPGKKQPCQYDQLYDPFFKLCRNALTGIRRSLPTPPPPLLLREINNISDYTRPILKCWKVLLEDNEFVFVNNTVYVPKYKENFRQDQFRFRKDGRVEICSTRQVKFTPKFSPYMGLITLAGLGVSVIFLLLHLTAFCLVPELRNLSGKNMASLSVALLMGYISFITGRVLEGSSCLVVAIVTFYSFLASFIWMLTMAFDVWRTLRLATAELRVSAGKQWQKFITYSLWSWLAPAVVVLTALWAELSPDVSTDWRPGFTTNSCWFGQSKPLLIFFILPLAVVMLLNIIFFAISAHMVYSTSSTTRFTASSCTQRDFRLYLRLAVLMGLSWTLGLLAGVFDVDLLWYLFVLLNTLQGLFIFLAFTCNDKVIRGLAARRASKTKVIPRSFSWSTDSSNRQSHVEAEKTTDTLY